MAESRTPDRKVSGSIPGGGAAGEFSSPGSTFCADSLSQYPFHPQVTAVARKRPRSLSESLGGSIIGIKVSCI